MDWEFIAKYTPEFIHAGILTLKIGGIGIMLSIVVGILGSWVLYENFKFFKQIIIGYVELSRNTPLLVQLFFLYYGLPKIGIKFSPELCGIIGLTFLDMMFVTKDLIGLYYKTEESLFMLVVGYLIILLPLSLFGVWLERKLKYVGYSN